MISMNAFLQDQDWGAFKSIDTAFEAAGLLMAQSVIDALFVSLLPVIVLSGMAFVIYQAVTKQELQKILLYFFYILVVYFLMAPIHVSGETESIGGRRLRAPRLLVWMNSVCDFIVGRAGTSAAERWREAFRIQTLTQTLAAARIKDPALKEALGTFLEKCFVPALARQTNSISPAVGPSAHDPFGGGASGSSSPVAAVYATIQFDLDDNRYVSCADLARGLKSRLNDHVKSAHGKTIEKMSADLGAAPEKIAALYTSRVIYNEMYGESPSDSLDADFVRYTPSYIKYGERVLGQAQSQPSLWDSVNPITQVGNVFSGAWSLAKESLGFGLSWLTKEMSPVYARYMVVMMGPVIYVIVMMILMAMFPIVAVFSFWPFQAKVLLNFFKVFLSVKLWVLFWVMIGRIESSVMGGSAETLFETHEVSASSIGLAASAMYIVVPMLSYLVVSMGTSAIAVPIAGMRDSGMTEGYGTVKTTGQDAMRVGTMPVFGEGADSKKMPGSGGSGQSRLPVGLRSQAAAGTAAGGISK
jgi:hypothetical protein